MSTLADSESQEVAFCLFKYFPYGGLQRNFLRTAQAVRARGLRVRVYTMSWDGDVPEGIDVRVLDVHALTNHARYRRFARRVESALRAEPVACTVGFNRMRHLDVHYAADPCYVESVREGRGAWYRLTPRYRYFAGVERAIFGRGERTRILLIAPRQRAAFERCYGTEAERVHLLSPGIARDRMAGDDASRLRAEFRAELGLAEDALLLLLLGSGFRTKGLDRALLALSHLPDDLAARTTLLAVGQDNPRPHLRRAARLGVSGKFRVLPGRSDVPRILQGADLLVHPAYAETAGNVLLEAVVAGLPSVVTDVCGNSPYVAQAGAGCVLPSPFRQSAFDAALAHLLRDADARARLRANGIAFGRCADIFDLPTQAADFIVAVAEEQSRDAHPVPA